MRVIMASYAVPHNLHFGMLVKLNAPELLDEWQYDLADLSAKFLVNIKMMSIGQDLGVAHVWPISSEPNAIRSGNKYTRLPPVAESR
jgi:hypothetical protein